MAPTAWSREEIELIVADYLSMLIDELQRIPFSKAAHRKALIPKLRGRSDGSVEYKHQNISAVLLDLGYPCIDGYKPAQNFQGGLFPEIVRQQAESNAVLQALLDRDLQETPQLHIPSVADILTALVAPPDRRIRKATGVKEGGSQAHVKKRDYAKMEAENSRLGLLGEQFAVNFEKARLIHAGKEHLADKIEHCSVTQGDGLGYDIRSYEATGADRLIEVKTTRYTRYAPFYLSQKELQISRERQSEYHLYRIFNFANDPKLFTLSGQLESQVILTPIQYLAQI